MENLKSCRVNVMISDMDAAIGFYGELLGLEVVNRYGDHYAEVQAPGLLIGLHPETGKVTRGNNLSIGLGVTDFEGTVGYLEGRGVACQVARDGYIRLAHFTDPDGNALFLAERPDE